MTLLKKGTFGSGTYMAKAKFQLRFGDTVKHLRNRLAMTQEELAGRAGLHRTYVSDIERGARNISLESIEKLAVALEISLPALFTAANESDGDVPALKDGPDGREMVDIFLIEDDLRDVELTQRAFNRARISNRVNVIRDGAAALDYFLGSQESVTASRYSRVVILLDLNLPKVSGMEVLRQLKADVRTRSIPVVVLTVSQRSRDIIEAQALGADSYLVKPVAFENFSQIAPKLSLHWALISPISHVTV